jgi:hypothetical protein
MKLELSIVVLAVVVTAGCGKMKFDKAKWDEGYEIGFPPPSRNKMLSDLVENHKLKGAKYNEVISLLGQPNVHDSMSFSYDIAIDYFGIDPVYVKYLEFVISKDSVITAFHVEEWKQGQDER